MKSKIIFTLLLLTSTFFTQCKKYEEDDVFIQWKKPEKRLIKFGPWVFDELLEDNFNISNQYLSDSTFIDKLYFIKQSVEVEANFRPHSPYIQSSIYGSFTLRDKSNKLVMGIGVPSNYSNLGHFAFLFNNIIWDIKRLDSKYLVLSGENNGKRYRLTYKTN